jgi:cytosine deaminase
MSGHEEIDAVFDLITTNAAKVLQLEDCYGITEGKPADFLLLDAPTTFDALRLLPARLHVFKHGREVATTTPARSVLRRGADAYGAENVITFLPQIKPE